MVARKYPFHAVTDDGVVIYEPTIEDIKLEMRNVCRAAWHYFRNHGIKIHVKTVNHKLALSRKKISK